MLLSALIRDSAASDVKPRPAKRPSMTESLKRPSTISTPPSTSKPLSDFSLSRRPRNLSAANHLSVFSLATAPVKRARLDVAAEAAAKTPIVSEHCDFSATLSRASTSVKRSTAPASSAPSTASLPPVNLTKDQQRFVDLVASGCCVFCTGQAGSGKSLSLRHALKAIQSRPYPVPDNRTRAVLKAPPPPQPLARGQTRHQLVAITAFTGTAALSIEGSTLHSVLGLRPNATTAQQVIESMPNVRRMALQSLNTLVIDEVSMLSQVRPLSLSLSFFSPLTSVCSYFSHTP